MNYAYLMLSVVIILCVQNIYQKMRIKKLEDYLWQMANKEMYLAYAQTLTHLPRIQAIRKIRAKFMELGLVQAVQILEQAK